MQYEQIRALLKHQTELIEKIALESNLNNCLNDIAKSVEAIIGNNTRASILILDKQSQFHSATPCLSIDYNQIIDNLPIHQHNIPNTIAAKTVSSIADSSLQRIHYCQKFLSLALSNNLKSSCSVPIISSQKKVVGIFRLYFAQPQIPDEAHNEIINHFTHLAAIALDKHHLTQQQEAAQKQIEKLAFYDPLTNLPNRRLLMSRTQNLIKHIQKDRLFGALIFIDLNGFKRINDSLGHYVGDELLISVSQRLSGSIRDTDTIARIGGDEFVILIDILQHSKVEIEAEAEKLARRTLRDLEQYFELSGGRYRIDASIGIAVIDSNDSDAIEVLKHADAAMYDAKKHSHKQICFHNTLLQNSIDSRLRIESEINEALEHFSFHAYYQPQVDLNGKIIAAEALIRWLHPNKGVIFPGEFIVIAEQMGVIDRMQETILNEACETLALLLKGSGLSEQFRIALNICPSQLKTRDLPQTLMRTINHHKLSPDYFMLEITEGMLIEDIDRTVEILIELRSLGFKISIDDFGTGYSSLSYLNTLPVNEIKIDKSFISTLSNEPSTHGVIDTVISLSKHFSFDVIAEGVEEQEQLNAIREKEVKGIQGYLFARPMCQADFITWVEAA
jgi:diguanylate cyclase (GGDEF)-like protein